MYKIDTLQYCDSEFMEAIILSSVKKTLSSAAFHKVHLVGLLYKIVQYNCTSMNC